VENRARGGIATSSGRVKIHSKQALTLLELPVGSHSSWVSAAKQSDPTRVFAPGADDLGCLLLGQISSVQWRPQRSLEVLFSVVGGVPQSSGGNPTGFVSLHDVGRQQSTHVLSPREASSAPVTQDASVAT
jgi:hypothetical protein